MNQEADGDIIGGIHPFRELDAPNMALTDTAIRKAKPADKPKRMFDEGGLYVEISVSGGKLWRLKYRFGGKEKRLALGAYPAVSLADARKGRDAAKVLLAQEIDPGEYRKVQKAAKTERAANSFEVVAREWFAKHSATWAKSHSDKIIKRLENDVFPWIGARPIAEISAPEVLKVLHRIEGRGALDTAHRANHNCGQVFRYAVATGRTLSDPCRDLRGALPPAKHEHFASITEPAEVAALLRAIDGFRGTFIVQCALRLAPLLFVRPGELRNSKWAEFDLDKGEWRYVVSKTKTDHLVPLASQAVEILRELHALTGERQYVFPGRDPHKPMSDAAVNAALRRMGYDTKTEITGHGFRAMARTILHQELGVAPDIIEHQLAHRVPDALENCPDMRCSIPMFRNVRFCEVEMENVKRLKPQQLQAVKLLAVGTPAYQVAARLEVSTMTIYRWQRIPEFESKLNAITSSGLEEIAKQLNAAALTATETVQEILCDLTQPSPLRLKAALGVLHVMPAINGALEKVMQHRVADFDLGQRFAGVTYDHGGESCQPSGESAITL